MIDNSRKGTKNKIKIHYGVNDFYKHYISCFKTKQIDDTKNPFIIDKKTYNAILEDFHSEIKYEIIENRFDYELPFDLGMLGVRKFKPKIGLDSQGKLVNKLPVNPRATVELWKNNPDAKAKKLLVRYTNKHSDGYVFTIHYFKKYKAKFKNKTLYSFETVRSFKQQLNKKADTGTLDAYLLY